MTQMHSFVIKVLPLAYLHLGYVMGMRTVSTAAMKIMGFVVSLYPYILKGPYLHLKHAFSANWTCGFKRFDCGNPVPKCIAQSQICNDHPDCSDGSDEATHLCGQCQAEEVLSLTVTYT